MKYISKILPLLLLIALTSCEDFLGQVPSDRLTEEQIFSSRKYSERYLAGIYTYIPDDSMTSYNNLDGLSDDIDISFNERILDAMGDGFFYLGFDKRKNIIEFLNKNNYLIDCIKNKSDIFIYRQPVIIFIYMAAKEDYRLIDEIFTKIVNISGMNFYKQIEYLFNDLGLNPIYMNEI